MKSKRFMALLLAVVMLFSMTALAAEPHATGTNAAVDGSASSVVTVDAEPVQMTVTVPAILPATVDAQGTVLVATDAKVINHSYGPVAVTAIQAEAVAPWSLVAGDFDFAAAKVGSKQVSLSIDDQKANAAGQVAIPDGQWVIAGGDVERPFSYGVRIPAQKTAITAEPVKAVFTVDWYEGGNGSTQDPETGYSLRLDKDYLNMYAGTGETAHAVTASQTMVALLSAEESDEVTWNTSNADVATVDGGHITAEAVGTATVKASYHGLTATCVVNVQEAPVPLQAIGFSKNKVTLYKNESETVLLAYNPEKFTGSADVAFTVDGDAVSLAPTSLPGVTADQGPTALTLTSLELGTNTVTAAASIDGKTITTKLTVEVIPRLEGLTISGATSVDVDNTIRLTVAKNPGDARGKVTWTTSDASIATVNDRGKVTGVQIGTAAIIADCEGTKAIWPIEVTDPGPLADHAILYSDGTLVFQNGNEPDASHGTVVDDYTGFNTATYGWKATPWYSNRTSITMVEFSDATKPVSTANWFIECTKLTSIKGLKKLNTSNVTDMDYMFSGCRALTSLDVNGFDTSKVTSMYDMFADCKALTSLDVSGFDTSNAIYMGSMFQGCSRLTSLDVSGFDTSKVTKMGGMFSNCSALTSLDVSGLDTGNVTDMSRMFWSCSALTSLDVSGFNTSRVTNMEQMFSGCSALTSLDVSSFDTSNVTKMGSMFSSCEALTSLNVSSFDTSNVTDMGSMLSNCNALTSLDVSGFDTSSVTNMGQMFENCKKITSLDVSGFDTSNVTNMGYMFFSCSALTGLNLSSFDTRNVTGMHNMFHGCKVLADLDVSSFNTSNVANMYSMFYDCNALTGLDVSSFDTRNVTNMTNMFKGCWALTSLDLSGFDTSNVTNMGYMFQNCNKLRTFTLGPNFAFKGTNHSLCSGPWYDTATGTQYTATTIPNNHAATYTTIKPV